MAALWKRCFGIAVVVACMVGSQGKVVKPKPKEAPISDQARLLGTGTVGSGGGKIKLMHNKDCVIDIGTVQNPAANCKEILNKTCDEKAETGWYQLKTPAGRTVKAMCEMDWDGGGWTRILICGPLQAWDSFRTHDFIISSNDVVQMAQFASQVHFRSKSQPKMSATSKPQTSPIRRLRKGLALNDPHAPWEQFKDEWEGPYAERLSWNYRTAEHKPREKWPNVVWWAMNNPAGLHIVNDLDLTKLKDTDESKVFAGGDNFCHWSFEVHHMIAAAAEQEKIDGKVGGNAPSGRSASEIADDLKRDSGSTDSSGDSEKCADIDEPGRSGHSLEVYMR